MSGGVDSSVAALLTMRKGYDVIGATMKLCDKPETDSRGKTCGTSDDVADAASVCARLDIPHHVFDMRDEFDTEVMRRFAEIYRRGETPNPCIICNRRVKFGGLLRRALAMECDKIVTGHYAAVSYDAPSGRWLLQKAADSAKDQTYFLYTLTQRQLSHILFPVGVLTKAEVRAIAEASGFVNSRKHDSQDICFLTVRYTIGQRKGLGMGFNKPMYVCAKDVAARTVTLGDNADLFSRSVTARDVNLIAFDRLERPLRVTAKVRYSQREEPATLEQTDDDELHLEFDNPQRAVAPGQAVVCYDGGTVLCGGTIIGG